jgi:hypothetical protein
LVASSIGAINDPVDGTMPSIHVADEASSASKPVQLLFTSPQRFPRASDYT